jgi:hypothetical protein
MHEEAPAVGCCGDRAVRGQRSSYIKTPTDPVERPPMEENVGAALGQKGAES